MLLSMISVLDLLLRLLSYVVIGQVILSLLISFNVINTYNDFVRSFYNALTRICEPLYRPIRRILPDLGGIDFSPFVVLVLISILRMLLGGVALDLASSYAP